MGASGWHLDGTGAANMACKLIRPIILIGVMTALPLAVEAQVITPRPSVLFHAAESSHELPSVVKVAEGKDRLSPTIFGAVIFGVVAGAIVYEADAGPSDAKIPIVVGATVLGGLLGYFIGGMLGSSE